MNKKLKLRESKGITLVALIITIIILLILAGAALMMISGDNGFISSITSGKDAYEISEDMDVISEIRKEILVKNSGEVPLTPFADLLSSRDFKAIEGAEEYNGRKINNNELLVGCPHGCHVYLVTGDGTEELNGSLKDIPIITIQQLAPEEIDANGNKAVKLIVNISCEKGLKSITLPNGIEVTTLNAGNITSADGQVLNVTKVSNKEIQLEYIVTQSGKYIFKGKSKNDIIAKKTEEVDKVVPGKDTIIIAQDPETDTNGKVNVTISTTDTSERYYLEYRIQKIDGTIIQDWKTAEKNATETTDINCFVTAKLRDGRGNEGYAKTRNVSNIDRLKPEIKEVKIASKTINTFTIQTTVRDQSATVEDGMSGIKTVKFYVDGALYATSNLTARNQEEIIACEVKTKEGFNIGIGTEHTYNVEVFDNAINSSGKLEPEPDPVTTLYQITYDGNRTPIGSTAPTGSTATQTKDKNIDITLQQNGFTRTGYIFTGWNTSADGTGTAYAAGGTYSANASATLYAQWTPITYTVAYNGNENTGGSTASSSHTYDEAKALTANGFTREYTVTFNANGGSVTPTSGTATWSLDGWATSAAGAKVYNNQHSVSNLTSTNGATVTLYAKWAGGTLASLPTPTRTGYTFGGWYTAASGGTQITTSTQIESNRTIYAHWTAYTYTVAYDGNGATSGVTAIQRNIQYDQTFNLSANGFAKAYTVTYDANGGTCTTARATATWSFGGWATSAAGAKVYNNQHSVSNLTSTNGATVTLYAKWTGGTLASLPTPTRTGYIFKGWFTAASGGTQITTSTQIESNRTIYAQWDPITYTIAYDGNGATSGSTEPKTNIKYDENVYMRNNGFSKTGYTFAGWAASPTGNVEYYIAMPYKNLTTTNEATVTLYAKWTPKTYTVTFNANGGTCTVANKTVTYDSTYGELPTPTRTGYTFVGWYNLNYKDCPLNYYADVNADLKAAFGYNEYSLYSHWVNNGIREGRHVSVYDSRDIVNITSNITMYAGWIANQYTITFNANGGTCTVANKTVTYDSTYGTLPTPTRTGYTFVGWYNLNYKDSPFNYYADIYPDLEQNGVPREQYAMYNHWVGYGIREGRRVSQYISSDTVNITNNITVYAGWLPKQVNVTFVKDEDKEKNVNVTKTYTIGVKGQAFNDNGWSKTGYTLTGWKSVSNDPHLPASGAYAVNNGINDTWINTHSATGITLYGVWEPSTYTVTFDPNGGSVSPTSKTVTYGSTYGTLPTPTKSNYVFRGWWTAPSEGTQVTATTTVTATSSHTLYAHWAPVLVSTSNFSYEKSYGGGSGTSHYSYTLEPGQSLTIDYSLSRSSNDEPSVSLRCYSPGGLSFFTVSISSYTSGTSSSNTVTNTYSGNWTVYLDIDIGSVYSNRMYGKVTGTATIRNTQ